MLALLLSRRKGSKVRRPAVAAQLQKQFHAMPGLARRHAPEPSRVRCAVLNFLLACVAGDLSPVDAPAADDPAGYEELPGSTDGDDTSEPDDDDPAPDSDEALWGCSDLFEQDRLPTYHLTLDRRTWNSLQSEFTAHDGTKGYHDVEAFEVDGETLPDVSIRLKGNEGYSWVGTKMQFVISFVEVNEDQRFHGQRHVAFDATWYDPTLLNNRTATRFLRRLGQPAPCANNALMYINDEYYGIYAHMEEPDREYLERNFGKENADGNLYKYGYELKNNPGADTSRVDGWWSSYEFEDLERYGDPDQWVSEWAAEATMPDWDGYWISGHNYFIYDHPERGFMYLPWDLDATFGYYDATSYDPLTGIYWDYVPHERSVLSQDEYEQRFIEYIAEYAEKFDAETMDAELLEWDDQIRDWLDADPNKYYTIEEHDARVIATRRGLGERRDFLTAWAEYNLGR